MMGFSMAQGQVCIATSSCLYGVLFLMQSAIVSRQAFQP